MTTILIRGPGWIVETETKQKLASVIVRLNQLNLTHRLVGDVVIVEARDEQRT